MGEGPRRHMNTTEIITRLRVQAAELTAMADALESTESATLGRYLIHGAVRAGDWTTYENLPYMTLAEDSDGDYFVKLIECRTWVCITDSDGDEEWSDADSGTSHPHDCLFRSLRRCRVIALDLTGHEKFDALQEIIERFKASQVPA